MRPSRFRRLAALALLAVAGCLDDPPTAATGAGGAVALRMSAQLAPAEGERLLGVRVSYRRGEGGTRVDLPVSPSRVVVPAGRTVQRAVMVEVAPCFADALRQGDAGKPGCALEVELTLLDAAGSALASEARLVSLEPGASTLVVPPFSLATVTLNGTVRSALDGLPASGVAVELFAGAAAEGAPLATATTGSDGIYLFVDVPPGSYTLRASGSGLLPATQGPVVVFGTSVSEDVVVSPVLRPNELRVVLTWGAAPADLDAHLWGPPAGGGWHVSFARRAVPPWAALDRDDTTAFGPETITITEQAAGAHVYAVHDFRNAARSTSRALAASGARVQVYRSSGLVAEFRVPDLPGTLWTVFELDGATIRPIGRVTAASPLTRPSTAAFAGAVDASSALAAPPPPKGGGLP